MDFSRYAIYYAPPQTAAWAILATDWLGWDMAAGAPARHPEAGGLNVADITERPRKYGLHGTIKPPFRLAPGTDPLALADRVQALCDRLAPVRMDGLAVARLGSFLALRPQGDTRALGHLAAACVEDLDGFRAPAPETELARRRGAGLSDRQERYLQRWGYPYVMEEFRFHITLSGRLNKSVLPQVETWLSRQLDPLLPRPFEIADLALVGEGPDGKFRLIHRYTLSG